MVDAASNRRIPRIRSFTERLANDQQEAKHRHITGARGNVEVMNCAIPAEFRSKSLPFSADRLDFPIEGLVILFSESEIPIDDPNRIWASSVRCIEHLLNHHPEARNEMKTNRLLSIAIQNMLQVGFQTIQSRIYIVDL